MLATFVIGLREGLEAALIIGIIAAFLKQSGRPDALRKMWAGVAVAIALCLAVGVVLQSVNSSLPRRQQEMLECVVAGIAVVMVSYMVLWMRKHSRSLKSDLQKAAGGALAAGSATALVVMAFLAVFREGFETAVFLLAAFQSAVSPALAAAGALLGIVIAIGLGYLIYRGGVKLNLSRFFRITGVVLVLVAAGLVVSTLRAAYEAGLLAIGQQQAVSLTVLARPGTVQESLLTGVLGIRSSMPVIEVVAYVLYLVPMLAVVLWPAAHAPGVRQLGRMLVGGAAAALVVAAGLVAVAPASSSASTTSAARLQVASSTSGTDPATGHALAPAATVGSVVVTVGSSDDAVVLTGLVTGSGPLRLSGSTTVGGVPLAQFSGGPLSSRATSAGLPSTLTLEQVAALGAGRLPIGLSVNGSSQGSFAATYSDSSTPTVTIDPATGVVVDLKVSAVRSVLVKSTTGQTFSLGAIAKTQYAATDVSISGQLAAAAHVNRARADQQVVGEVIPGLLTVFALILLGFGLPHLIRGRRRDRSAVLPRSDLADGAHEQLVPTGTSNRGT